MSFFKSPLNINIPNINFRGPAQSIPVHHVHKDGFISNPLYDNLADISRIEYEAQNNPKIRALMKEYDLPIVVNTNELEKLKQGHLKNTRMIAVQIYSNLPPYMKKDVNLKNLQEAAMMHDYGKVLIPNKILNKNGNLNEKEKEIMNLHSELGYELLKNRGLDEATLDLIKYHHQNPMKSGYPAVNNNYEHSLEAQILNAADEYTALREERSYKKALSKEEALNILQQRTEQGFISPEVFSALKRAV